MAPKKKDMWLFLFFYVFIFSFKTIHWENFSLLFAILMAYLVHTGSLDRVWRYYFFQKKKKRKEKEEIAYFWMKAFWNVKIFHFF